MSNLQCKLGEVALFRCWGYVKDSDSLTWAEHRGEGKGEVWRGPQAWV